MERVESLAENQLPPPRDVAWQQCIRPSCGATYGLDAALQRCERCGALLDVAYDWERVPLPSRLGLFDQRRATWRNPLDYSGVWRFRELLPFAELDKVVTIGEGQTQLRRSDGVGAYVGLRPGNLFLQYEGLNPSGSFKDNGMTGAFTHARMVGARLAACASTGNTSASLAMFAGVSGLLKAVVFVGSGKIAYGKLSQALDYGATTLQIEGDFDDAMRQVQEVCRHTDLYLMNSLNPFRLEGQKAIMYRVLEGLGWRVPDWVVVPGGNLGNSSAFGKAFAELHRLGLIERLPRIAIINSTGADTLARLVNEHGLRWNGGRVDDAAIEAFYWKMDSECRRARTIASAIEINRPVDPGREGPGGRPRLRVRACLGGLGGGRQAPARGRRHRPRRTRRLHPHRPPAQGPPRHGRLPRIRRGAAAGGVCRIRRRACPPRQPSHPRPQRHRRHPAPRACELDMVAPVGSSCLLLILASH